MKDYFFRTVYYNDTSFILILSASPLYRNRKRRYSFTSHKSTNHTIPILYHELLVLLILLTI